MRRLRYEDFTVALEARGDGRFTARAVNASVGGAGRHDFELPWSGDELASLLRRLGASTGTGGGAGNGAGSGAGSGAGNGIVRHLRPSARMGRQRVAPSAREIGAALFQALFQGSLRDQFMRGHGRVEDRPDLGLRLRLRFDPASAADLDALPWELLYWPQTGDFLSRRAWTPVVRQWDVARSTTLPPLEKRLRVLAVLSQAPQESQVWGQPQLDLEGELERMESTLGPLGIEVRALRQPTRATLREELRETPVSILHFMGHGDVDPSTGEGRLWLQGEAGSPVPVAARPLAETLQASRTLRLVFLNACETAGAGSSPGDDSPFRGIAAALQREGVPAVLAMRWRVGDAAAVRFSETVYGEVARGELLEAAVAEGRHVLFAEAGGEIGPLEWANPVLFMSLPEGALLEPSATTEHPAPVPIRPPRAPAGSRERTIFLEHLRSEWIERPRRQALHRQAWVALDMEGPDGLAPPPWERRVIASGDGPRPLAPDEPVVDVFRRHGRALVILGDPGSGKSVTLSKLAGDLLEEALGDPGAPVPVLFELSSWDRREASLESWMLGELVDKFRIGREIGGRWLREGRILPLLDGLDEVPAARRAACAGAIDEHARGAGRCGLAVTCRLEEYRSLPRPLSLDAALLLEPLSDGRIAEILAGPKLRRLREAVEEDEDLRGLAHSPLLLGMMTLTYGGEEAIPPGPRGVEERRGHLLETFIQKMLGARGGEALRREPARLDFLKRLGWLARQMARRDQRTFHIEALQPDWLDSRADRWIYLLASRALPALPLALLWGAVGLGMGLGDGASARTAVAVLLLATGALSGTLIDAWRSRRGILETGDVETPWARLGATVLVTSLSWGGLFTSLVSLASSSFGRSRLAELGLVEHGDLTLFTGLFSVLLGASYWAQFGARSWRRDIQPSETVRWSPRLALRTGVITALMATIPGILLTTGLMQSDVLLEQLDLGPGQSPWPLVLRILLTISAVSGLGLGVLGGFDRGTVEGKVVPNQGIRLSARNGLIWGALTFGAVLGLTLAGAWPPAESVVAAFGFGLFAGLWCGGFDAVQHYLLRGLLARRGRLPWRLPSFLDGAAGLAFLHRVGGGYRFAHRILQEHFAERHDPRRA